MTMILFALLAAGQAVPTAPASSTAPATAQQQFDAASAAATAGRCPEAVRIFDQMDASGKVRAGTLLRAAIDVRRGQCLIRLDRTIEGVAAVERGLPKLIEQGPGFAADVQTARRALGDAMVTLLRYDDAARHYRAVLDTATGNDRIAPLVRLGDVTMFDRDGRALEAVGEARRLVLADTRYAKTDIAAVQTRYARALLNAGRAADAYDVLKDSLAKQGGLDMMVNQSDIATRSDLAIAAIQTGDVSGARRYLAYSGAGRLSNTPFVRAVEMTPPTCGDGGLTPQDVGIVEFSIEADGQVSGATPIYTTSRRDGAVAFARAVEGWSWRPEDIARIPALFRHTQRVELRCLTAAPQPPLTRPLTEAAAAWLTGKGANSTQWDEQSLAAAAPLQRAALARATSAGDTPGILAAAFALTGNAVVPDDEALRHAATAQQAAATLDAPVSVSTVVAIELARRRSRDLGGYREMLRALLARPVVAADPLAAATVALLIAQTLDPKRSEEAGQLYDRVVAQPGLADTDPLRIAALLGQSNVHAARKDMASAQAAFARTGLSGEQCATLGLEPAQQRSGASAGAFPQAALEFGFEGWTRTEFDVAADGRTVAPRVVIAYPPFVFDEAGLRIASGARYASTFRPDGAIACAGQQQQVRFELP